MLGAALIGFVQQSMRADPEGSAHASLPQRLKAWWAGPCPGRHPFKVRLHAWWEGVKLPPPPAVEEQEAPADAANAAQAGDPADPVLAEPADDAEPIDPWTKERVEILESVFGGGALNPGGIPAILKMVQPLGLDSSMSVLEFGAGIGGYCRALAEKFDTWVTGVESSPLLVEIATVRAHTTGMTKKAPVLHESLESPEIRPRYYNAIYSRDALYMVGKKDALLRTLIDGLRPKGQITFIDYVANDDLALVSSEIAAWKQREPCPVHLWTAERYKQALVMQKLDVRTVEDVTEEVKADIISAWGNYLKTLNIKALGSGAAAAVLINEAELWASRFKALSSGRLRSVRIYAMKK